MLQSQDYFIYYYLFLIRPLWWCRALKYGSMVSQSRLYLALLAVMAIMAFWLGLWCSAVSNYEDFREPKPRAADEIFFVEVEKKPVSKNFKTIYKCSYKPPESFLISFRSIRSVFVDLHPFYWGPHFFFFEKKSSKSSKSPMSTLHRIADISQPWKKHLNFKRL